MTRLLIVIPFLILSCSTPKESTETRSDQRTEIEVKYATGFKLYRTENGYDLEVRNPQDTTTILDTYHFISGIDSSAIQVPVKSVVLNSTTFGAFFDRLDALARVKGMTYTSRVMNESIKDRISTGQIQEVISGDGINFERMIEIDPDVVLAYHYGEADFSRYEEVNIPIVLIMDYMESHPLGRAEWIKVIGCILNQIDSAEEIFAEIENAYMETRNQAMLHSTLPSAFTGSKYGDFWYAPGRDSYIAKFIQDAGATYAFDHIEGQASAELDFEQAFSDISKIDFWGLVVSSPEEFTKKDILEMSPLYENLEAYENDQIFVCNSAESDYFGDAILEPHLILKDLHQIFHPSTSEDTTFYYFKPIH